MPELTGIVTAKSEFGIKLDVHGDDWLNWSREEYRKEPWEADKAEKGKYVVCTVGERGKYISTIKVLSDGPQPTQPESPPGETKDPGPPVWGLSGKDTLIAKISSVKTAGELYAACITAGLVKELPTPAVIKAYAEAIEAKL